MGEDKKTQGDVLAERTIWRAPASGGALRLVAWPDNESAHFGFSFESGATEGGYTLSRDTLVTMAHAILRHYGEE